MSVYKHVFDVLSTHQEQLSNVYNFLSTYDYVHNFKDLSFLAITSQQYELIPMLDIIEYVHSLLSLQGKKKVDHLVYEGEFTYNVTYVQQKFEHIPLLQIKNQVQQQGYVSAQYTGKIINFGTKEETELDSIITDHLHIHGNGSVKYPDGSSFVGSFKNGSLDNGTLKYFLGHTFVGSFKNNKRYDGIMTYGDKQQVVFKNGFGTSLSKKLKGSYKTPEFTFSGHLDTGDCQVVFSHNQTYEGAIEEGMLSGHAKINCPNTHFNYEGNCSFGRCHGAGIMTCFSSTCTLDGTFDLGRFVQGTLSLQNGPVYTGSFQDRLLMQGSISFERVSKSTIQTIHVSQRINSCSYEGKILFKNGDTFEGTIQYDLPLMGKWKQGTKTFVGTFQQGTMDKNWVYTGYLCQQGVIDQDSNDIYRYTGDVFENKAHGQGERVYICYSSAYKNCLTTVESNDQEITQGNALVETGTFEHDLLHGENCTQSFVYKYSSDCVESNSFHGTFVHGSCVQGKMFNSVVHQSSNKPLFSMKYEGQLKHAVPSESGHLKVSQDPSFDNKYYVMGYDNFEYHGQFTDGLMNGKGTFVCAGGSFSGMFRDNMIVSGTYQRQSNKHIHSSYADVQQYKGEFQDGIIHGVGTCKRNHCVEQGTFQAGVLVEGKRQDKDDLQQGTFVNSLLEGEGKILYPNGMSLSGSFKQGKLHGLGIRKEEKFYFEGNFKDGKPCFTHCPKSKKVPSSEAQYGHIIEINWKHCDDKPKFYTCIIKECATDALYYYTPSHIYHHVNTLIKFKYGKDNKALEVYAVKNSEDVLDQLTRSNSPSRAGHSSQNTIVHSIADDAFVYQSYVGFQEDEFTEFKAFYNIVLPIQQSNEFVEKYIVAFLNARKHGRLYFGISDEGICHGTKIANDQITKSPHEYRDDFRNIVSQIVRAIHINAVELVRYHFYDVYRDISSGSQTKYLLANDRYVVCIEVLGDQNPFKQIYETPSDKKAWYKNHNSTNCLTPTEICELLQKILI